MGGGRARCSQSRQPRCLRPAHLPRVPVLARPGRRPLNTASAAGLAWRSGCGAAFWARWVCRRSAVGTPPPPASIRVSSDSSPCRLPLVILRCCAVRLYNLWLQQSELAGASSSSAGIGLGGRVEAVSQPLASAAPFGQAMPRRARLRTRRADGARTSPSARRKLLSACAALAALAVHLLWRPCAHAAVSPGERQGLVNLYLATNGPNWWGITQGWHNHANASVDPCDPSGTTWTGVTCSGTTSITYVRARRAPRGG